MAKLWAYNDVRWLALLTVVVLVWVLLNFSGVRLFPASLLQPDYPYEYYDFTIPDAALNNVGIDASKPVPVGCVRELVNSDYRGNTYVQTCSSANWVSTIEVGPGAGSRVYQLGGKLYVSNEGNGFVSVRSNRDVGSVDWQVKGRFLVSGNGPAASMRVGSETASAGLSSGTGGEFTQPVTVTVLNSRLNETYQEAFLNGVFAGSGFYKGDKRGLNFETKGSNSGVGGSFQGSVGVLELSSVRYRPIFSCTVGSGEVLGDDTFPSGYAVNGFALSRSPIKYCQVSVFKEGQGASFDEPTSSEIFTRVINGETLYVPSGQVWRVFYVFKNDGTIFCSADESFDFTSGSCGVRSGLASFCRGELDPVTGLCATTAQDRCSAVGGFYNRQDGSCYRAYANQAACPYFNAAFIPEFLKCIANLQEDSCTAEGGIWNLDRNWCEWDPVYYTRCVNPLATIDPVSGNCTSLREVAYVPGMPCVGELIANGTYNFICKVKVLQQPVVSYEPPKCSGDLLKTAEGVYVCKLKVEEFVNETITTVIVRNETVTTVIVRNETLVETRVVVSAQSLISFLSGKGGGVPGWVYAAVGAASVSGFILLLLRLKGK